MHTPSRWNVSLLALSWAAFAAAFAWTCSVQGKWLWWLTLNWSGWLTDLSAIATLERLPAGSVWIAWLGINGLLTVMYLLQRPVVRTTETLAPAAAPRRPFTTSNAELIDARPELKEKILRLHESLDRI